MDRRGYKRYIVVLVVLAVLGADQINKATNNATNAVGQMESRLNSLNLIRSMTHADMAAKVLTLGLSSAKVTR